MKNIYIIILVFYSSTGFAGWGGNDGWSFYNLFKQTNISATEFYPFLREDFSTFSFYGDSYYNENKATYYPKGNIDLWQELLTNWKRNDIENAVYGFENFSWSDKTSKIEKRTKIYQEFAQLCSDAFSYRNKRGSWDYNEIIEQKKVDSETLLSKASILLSREINQQLKTRYYYQIIRILHYSKDWNEAISFYETKIENKLPENEIYYYILDQVAGCYYSIKN